MAETQLVLSTVVKGTESVTRSLNDVKKSIDGVGKAAKDSGKNTQSFTQVLEKNKEGFQTIGVAAGVATAGIIVGIRGAMDEAVKFENAFIGLKSVVLGTGNDFKKAEEFIKSYVKDGLVTAGDAATSLKNLLSRGFGMNEAADIMIRFKDSASFARQGSLSLGEAIRGGTEGLKNSLSMMVDNVGVTRNLSDMWQDYAKSIGVGVMSLTDAQKRQAEYNGIINATRYQIGDAAKLSDSYSGSVARQDAAILKLQQTIGKSLMPAMTKLIEALTEFLEPVAKWIEENPKLSATIILVTLGITALTAAIVAIGLVIAPVTAAFTALGAVLTFLSANPVVLITAAIIALVAALIYVYKNWETIKPKLLEFWENLKSGIQITINQLKDYFSKNFPLLTYIVEKEWERMGAIIDGIIKGIRAAIGVINEFTSASRSIGSSIYKFTHPEARASGGPVNGGQTYMVGERGPELFTPGTSGQIIPNNRIGGSGGIVINITGMFGQNAADEIGNHIINRLKGASYI